MHTLDEEALVGVLKAFLGITEETETDGTLRDLRHVVALEALAGDHARGALDHQVLHDAVEAAGGDSSTGADEDAFGGVEHVFGAEAGLSGDEQNRRLGQEEELAADGRAEFGAKLFLVLKAIDVLVAEGLLREVPLVDHEDEATTEECKLTGELLIDTGHALAGVEHEEDHVSLGEDLVGTDLREEIEGVAFVGGATTSGVDERELRLRAVGLGAGKPGAHRVAGRTGDFADDQAGGAKKAVAERALTDVRATGQGEANRAGAFFARGRRLRAEQFNDERL